MMKKILKSLPLILIFIISISCSLPFLSPAENNNSSPADNNGSTSGEPTANPDTPIYFGRVVTEAIPVEYLVPVKVATLKSMAGVSTYALLENQSTDLINVVDGFNYKLTYLDVNNFVVAEQTLEEVASIFPGEKQLVNYTPNIPEENRELIITRARFEITKIIPAQIHPDYYDRVRSLKLPDPLIAVTGQPFQIEIIDQGFFKTYNAKTSVVLQNNLNAEIEAEAVALFLDANGEIVGQARTGGVILPPNGQANFEITAFDLCGEVAGVEYYAFPSRSSGWSEIYYEVTQ
jgi:hypothetical protein